jgi:hypothetical protein
MGQADYLLYNNNGARAKCSTNNIVNCSWILKIVKKRIHIGAFTLLTKTTKHTFHNGAKLTIVQHKSTFWGESQEKYTNPQSPYQ